LIVLTNFKEATYIFTVLYWSFHTLDIQDTDFSKEVSIPQNSKLSYSIISHHCQLPLFNDVHLMTYITLLAYILSWAIHLKMVEEILV